jgi:hypothetical protein
LPPQVFLGTNAVTEHIAILVKGDGQSLVDLEISIVELHFSL